MKIVIGNLKMNILTLAERSSYFESFKRELAQADLSKTQIVLCPPVLHLESFAQNLATDQVAVGAQNVFWEERGSFTGENSVLAVKNFGASFVLVGHSESRKFRGETDEIVNAKLKAVLKNSLQAILCIGETEVERAQGKTAQSLAAQLAKGLAGVGEHAISRLLIAYEPVWAIGSGKTPTSDEILAVKILLRKILLQTFSETAVRKIKLLYGGSVNARLVDQVCLDPGLDGVLVGRESLIPRELINIAKNINN